MRKSKSVARVEIFPPPHGHTLSHVGSLGRNVADNAFIACDKLLSQPRLGRENGQAAKPGLRKESQSLN